MSSLVSAAELAAALAGDDPPVLLDARWRLQGPPAGEDYAAGHIPGAIFVDLDRDLSGPPGPRGRHPLPDPADLQRAARRWGLRADRGIVAYDYAEPVAAARAWWVLRWAGLDDVRVLDGGFAAWQAAGLPVSTDTPRPVESVIELGSGGMPLLDAKSAAELARRGVLLDVRAAERYRGEVEPMDPVAGHIPGARSAPISGNLLPDGRMLPAEDLRERFAGVGVTGEVEVGAYCGSGVTAAHEVLALDRAGIPAALYVGSWSEWVADPSREVRVGAQP